jgi:hypothetical protein
MKLLPGDDAHEAALLGELEAALGERRAERVLDRWRTRSAAVLADLLPVVLLARLVALQ